MADIRLLILGAGRFAADVADWAGEIPGVQPVGFFQDRHEGDAESLDGLPILSEERVVEELPSLRVVCAIGARERASLISKVSGWGGEFTTLVHPTARVSRRAELGLGCLVAPLASVAAHASLGRHVIVNRCASVGHHAAVDDYALLGPGSTISGSSSVGTHAQVGSGATVRDGIRIGAGATLALGSAAIRDVPDGATAIGCPARVTPLP